MTVEMSVYHTPCNVMEYVPMLTGTLLSLNGNVGLSVAHLMRDTMAHGTNVLMVPAERGGYCVMAQYLEVVHQIKSSVDTITLCWEQIINACQRRATIIAMKRGKKISRKWRNPIHVNYIKISVMENVGLAT